MRAARARRGANSRQVAAQEGVFEYSEADTEAEFNTELGLTGELGGISRSLRHTGPREEGKGIPPSRSNPAVTNFNTPLGLGASNLISNPDRVYMMNELMGDFSAGLRYFSFTPVERIRAGITLITGRRNQMLGMVRRMRDNGIITQA